MEKQKACRFCQTLEALGLDKQSIKDYHDGKIGFNDLPSNIAFELVLWAEADPTLGDHLHE
jgi:hypothetical protein